MERFEELKAIGWNKMNKEERLEYQALKANPPESNPVIAEEMTNSNPVIAEATTESVAFDTEDLAPPQVSINVREVLQLIHSEIKDSDDKGALFSLMQKDLDPLSLKTEIFKVVKDGDSRAVVHRYI